MLRFHQLDIGVQFEFKGERYTKSNDLIAVRQDGSQKFMQRSAMVKPVDAHSEPSAPSADISGMIEKETVVKAHERFYQTCMASINNTSLSKPEQSELAKMFKAASKEFLQEIS